MKTALVLSGGGARGAYEAGVIKALNELNIKCDIVTGVSIGSINAACYTQGNTEQIFDLWKNINYRSIFECKSIPNNKKELRKNYIKAAKNKGMEPINLKKILIKNLDIDRIYNSSIDFGLITVKSKKLEKLELTKKDINKNEFIDYLIASCTIFPVFEKKIIDDVSYVDGGYVTSIPYELALNMGAKKLIIVNISAKQPNFKPNKKLNAIYIKPNNKLGSPIVFDSKVSRKNLKYGYNDTMKVFKKFYGKKYTFKTINYKKTNIFNSLSLYINTIEYLAKSFNMDDTRIYNISAFDKIIKDKISCVEISEKNKLKDLKTKHERIIFVYKRLMNNKVIRQDKKKRVLNIEYRAAYYLYNLTNEEINNA